MIRKAFFLFILVLSVTAGCTRKLSPAGGINENDKNVDRTEYERYYVEALKQKLIGNTGESLKYFEMCKQINPAADAPYYEMAQILAATGDAANAKKYALTAAGRDGKNLWYMMLVSQLYYREKNLDSAIIWHEKAVKAFPDNENMQLSLGDLYIENRQYEKANQIFDSFDKKYGINETSTVSSVRSLMASGKYNEARVKLNLLLAQNPDELLYNGLMAEIYRSEGNKDQFIATYSKMLEKNPGQGEVQLTLAEFLAEEKIYDQLFSMLNAIVMNESISKEDKISFFGRLIENYDYSLDRQNSLTLTLMVLESTYKGDNIIPLLRPELMVKAGKLEEAAKRLEELTRELPDNYYAWEKLLFVYLDQKDYQKLTVKGAECATKFNTSFIAKMLYATGATETGKYDLALNELKKAEILAGENREMLLQVLNVRADVYYKNKEYSKAFASYEEAIKSDPEDITVMNNYAYYLAEQNLKLKEAEELARKVIGKEKDNSTYLDTYGWVLYKRGKFNEAAKVFESIIADNKVQDAEWHEHYGFVLQKQNKCSKAIEAWKTALMLDPSKIYLNTEIENCKK
ncbi:MAG TPA: tetratricopeptide repeat protein [Bacteroidales bacterium]|nr:tetratricopeptide repeat protein [Bacteroidales bacterium]